MKNPLPEDKLQNNFKKGRQGKKKVRHTCDPFQETALPTSCYNILGNPKKKTRHIISTNHIRKQQMAQTNHVNLEDIIKYSILKYPIGSHIYSESRNVNTFFKSPLCQIPFHLPILWLRKYEDNLKKKKNGNFVSSNSQKSNIFPEPILG
jgi:hypothetical protein